MGRIHVCSVGQPPVTPVTIHLDPLDVAVGNVWLWPGCHRLATCDHLLDIKSWKHGDPPPTQGISFATGHILCDSYQTPTNPKETNGGDLLRENKMESQHVLS